MHNLPSRARLNITFTLEKNDALARGLREMHPLEVVLGVEGNLTICIGSEVFFHTDLLPVMELGIAFERWLRRVRKRAVEDFVYESMEHSEPILQFFRQRDDTWTLYSIWQEFECKERFSTADLLQAVEGFLGLLKAKLNANYGLNLEDYLWQYGE